MAQKPIVVICKSVFQSGKNISRSQFTKKWVEMVNRIEKSKRTNPPKP